MKRISKGGCENSKLYVKSFKEWRKWNLPGGLPVDPYLRNVCRNWSEWTVFGSPRFVTCTMYHLPVLCWSDLISQFLLMVCLPCRRHACLLICGVPSVVPAKAITTAHIWSWANCNCCSLIPIFSSYFDIINLFYQVQSPSITSCCFQKKVLVVQVSIWF